MKEDIVKNMNNENLRPWGFYEVLADEDNHKVKRITVFPEKRLSLQRHKFRSEHWYFIEGKAIITSDNQEITAIKGTSFNIPQNSIHRISNIGESNCVFIEIQTGTYFGEDDIERLEDDFGRRT